MGYRVLLAIALLALMSGCAAFDTDNTPYAGFDPNLVTLPSLAKGAYNGSFTGTMTVDSNTCAGVSDKVGDAVDAKMDVVQSDNIVNIKFEDGSVSASELSADSKATFMVQTGTTKHVYYLTFTNKTNIDGTCEVIEADENGDYAKPCANYTVSLEKQTGATSSTSPSK